MQHFLETSELDTNIKEIEKITCVETSPVEEMAYVAGDLSSNKTRQSCPVLVLDLVNNEIKRTRQLLSNL